MICKLQFKLVYFVSRYPAEELSQLAAVSQTQTHPSSGWDENFFFQCFPNKQHL